MTTIPEQALFDGGPARASVDQRRYRMESWSNSVAGDDSTAHWAPMDCGRAAAVWRPRVTAREAVEKCAMWTGLIFIPAMRVVDLVTGNVVWMDRNETHERDAGSPIHPPWTQDAYAAAKASLRRGSSRRDAADAPVQVALLPTAD